MKNKPLYYKHYYGSVNIDPENNLLYGKVEFIKALITYEAEDVHGLISAFHEAIEDYLAFCQEKNIEPEKAFKGSLNVRLGQVRHRRAWLHANALNTSINEYICSALDQRFEEKEQPNDVIPKGGSTRNKADPRVNRRTT